jgi:hypothetical protein
MDDTEQRSDSLLPYDAWTEDALRLVAQRAIQFAAREGLPGTHHFYVTFRTIAPGVVIPPRLLAQYPQEMTIILQHQFWDLKVDDAGFSVGLSFGGIPTTLVVPFSALIAFADPAVQFGLRFTTEPVKAAEPTPPAAVVTKLPAPEPAPAEAPQVVSLDAFRRRGPAKEQDPP